MRKLHGVCLIKLMQGFQLILGVMTMIKVVFISCVCV